MGKDLNLATELVKKRGKQVKIYRSDFGSAVVKHYAYQGNEKAQETDQAVGDSLSLKKKSSRKKQTRQNNRLLVQRTIFFLRGMEVEGYSADQKRPDGTYINYLSGQGMAERRKAREAAKTAK